MAIKDQLFRKWSTMRSRVIGVKANERPTYANCKIDFENYSDFKSWAESQIGSNNASWHIDKDILKKGNKIYGKEFCVFVPPEINLLFTNSKAIRGELPVGVSSEKSRGMFFARLSVKGKNIFLGRYKTPTEAFEVYKAAKEDHVKSFAYKWKDEIDKRVYDAMLSYTVELTD